MSPNPGLLLSEAASSIRRSGGLGLVAVLALALASLVSGAWALLKRNTGAWEVLAGSRFEAVAYLSDSAGESGARLAFESVRTIEGVESGRVVSPSEALAELSREAAVGDWVQALGGENPLPWSLRIKLKDADPTAFKVFAQAAARVEGVSEVEWGGESVENMLKWLKFLKRALLVAGLALAAAAAVLTAAVIRLTIHARREEIAIMRMVGAGAAFIRLPLLMEGLLQGALGGILAALALKGGLAAAFGFAQRELGLSLSAWLPWGVDLKFGLQLVALSAAFGLMGSLLALPGALRERA